VIDQTNAERAFVLPFDELSRLADDAALLFELAGAEPEGAERAQALE
jgi:hypothetical protein